MYALYNASLAAGIDGSTDYADACEKLIEQFRTIEFTGLTGTMSWNESTRPRLSAGSISPYRKSGSNIGAALHAE